MATVSDLLSGMDARDQAYEEEKAKRLAAGVPEDPVTKYLGPIVQYLTQSPASFTPQGIDPNAPWKSAPQIPDKDASGVPLTPMAKKLIAEKLGINLQGTPPSQTPPAIPIAKPAPVAKPAAAPTPTATPTPAPVTTPTTSASAEAPAPSATVPPTAETISPSATPPPPFIPPEAPQEVDFKKEISNILSKIPDTPEGVTGRQRQDARTEFAQLPWYERLARGFVLTGQRKDFDNEIDRVQKDLNDRFNQDFEWAKSKMNMRTQMELKTLELQMAKEKEAREGYAKMWQSLGEANPERFMNDPNWWAMGGRAYGMTEESLRKWVQQQYDPATGKYHLYMSKSEQELRSKMSTADAISKMFPGILSKQDLLSIVINGKAPEWLGDRKKELENELYHPATTPERKNQIVKTIQDVENIKNLITPEKLAMLDKIKGQLDPETHRELRTLAIVGMTLGPHMEEVYAKSIEAKKIAGMYASMNKTEKSASPAEITQANVGQALNSGIGRTLLLTDPTYGLMGTQKEQADRFSKDYSTYKDLLARSSLAMAGDKSVQPPTKQEKQQLSVFFAHQREWLGKYGFKNILAIPNLTIFESNTAMDLAIEGHNPEQIANALLAARKQQVK